MSVSGVSSYGTSPMSGPRADFLQLRDSYKGIDSALQSGDLDAAKKALDDFKQALQDLPGRRGDQSQAGKPTRIADDLQSLDKALQSGDADEAKKAFETLTKDMQSIRHSRGHHHHRKDNDGDDQQTAGTSTSTTTGTTTSNTSGTGSVDLSV
jgi:soluble cytochrome b562